MFVKTEELPLCFSQKFWKSLHTSQLGRRDGESILSDKRKVNTLVINALSSFSGLALLFPNKSLIMNHRYFIVKMLLLNKIWLTPPLLKIMNYLKQNSDVSQNWTWTTWRASELRNGRKHKRLSKTSKPDRHGGAHVY